MKQVLRTKPLEILLVEDNLGDAQLIQMLLKNLITGSNPRIVDGGETALAFLRKEAPFENAPRPDLILLDLNLPGKDGRAVLVEIKQDPNLCRIPVVVLTSSTSEEDIAKSYEAHANSYISKPIAFEEFQEIILAIFNYWFKIVKLPSQ